MTLETIIRLKITELEKTLEILNKNCKHNSPEAKKALTKSIVLNEVLEEAKEEGLLGYSDMGAGFQGNEDWRDDGMSVFRGTMEG